jgi:hypothetical protein
LLERRRGARIAPGRRNVLLTALVKTRMREMAAVERDKRALARCIDQHHTVEEER